MGISEPSFFPWRKDIPVVIRALGALSGQAPSPVACLYPLKLGCVSLIIRSCKPSQGLCRTACTGDLMTNTAPSAAPLQSSLTEGLNLSNPGWAGDWPLEDPLLPARPSPPRPGGCFTFSAWLSSSLLLSLSLWGGSGPRPSSSNNCAFMVKSQAAVRSRALGLTGEGPYKETQL